MVLPPTIIQTYLDVITERIISMTKTFTGIPAPKFLTDDPWFGPAIISEKQHEYMLAELEKENILLPKDNLSEEVDNIHEVMYNLSTRCLSNHPSNEWLSGTGLTEVFQ